MFFLLFAAATATTAPTTMGGAGDENSTDGVPDEQRLLSKVLHNYNKNVRPVFRSNDSVAVTLGFTLIQIMDMVSGCVGVGG